MRNITKTIFQVSVYISLIIFLLGIISLINTIISEKKEPETLDHNIHQEQKAEILPKDFISIQ